VVDDLLRNANWKERFARGDKMQTRTIALCAVILIAALIVVGMVSNGELRHVVQTLPAWIVVALGMRNSGAVKWAAFPVFVIWLLIMILIWLFLLGYAKVITGHYSPIEIAMTIIVGVAALAGIVSCLRWRSGVGMLKAAIVLIVMTGLQVGAIALSTKPAITNDDTILHWLSGG
jgi:hypothetical protein